MKCALLETATGRIVREQDFAEVPPALAPEKGLQWYELIDLPPNYNPATQTRKPDGQVINEPARTITKQYRVDALPADAIAARVLKDVVDGTQVRLDAFARTRNYDGILSLCTYATSPTAKFSAEGQYGVDARDATWAKLYEMLAEVQAGTRPMPSGYADVEPELPALVWPT